MIKTGSKPLAIRSLVLVALCATLFSFSGETGMDNFTIYLNNKLLLKEYVLPEASLKSISLPMNASRDVLKVHYDHCGKIGMKRSLSVQNGQKKVLRTWEFPDDASAVMELEVAGLLEFTGNNQGLVLVYASREIPRGRALVAFRVSDDGKAHLK